MEPNYCCWKEFTTARPDLSDAVGYRSVFDKKKIKIGKLVGKYLLNPYRIAFYMVYTHYCHAGGRGFESRPDRK